MVGTLTLPAGTVGKRYEIDIVTSTDPATSTLIGTVSGTTNGSSIAYSIPYVPAGTYFVSAFVDLDASGGTSFTSGDYAGWYGQDTTAMPPVAPNAEIDELTTVTFDFGLPHK